MSRYRRYRFFKEHAGYVVGERAKGAIALMRAETLLEDCTAWDVARIEWEYDDFPYEHDAFTDDEIAEKFNSNEWTGPFTCLLYVGDEIVGALGGIVVGPRGTDDPYCRVVEAELADEAEDELRQALGDARDGRITCPA